MAAVNEKSRGMQITITRVSKLKSIDTSEISIHGIPWRVQVFKKVDGPLSCLAFRLICGNKDVSLGWPIAGAASCKLVPFSDDFKTHKVYLEPNICGRTSLTGYYCEIIRWYALFDQNKKYVKDDTIKLEFKIEAENPNNPNRSSVQFECVKKCCDYKGNATFRLTVKNISNLLAVRTTHFDLRGLHWNIIVGKDNSSDLFAHLGFDGPTKKISCNVTCTIKLLSSKAEICSIKQTQTETELYSSGYLQLDDIVSWDELLDPENGFVNNDSITMVIEIETNKPRIRSVDDLPATKKIKLNPENEIKTPQMECPICLKCIANQELAVTPCGHLFCLKCIKAVIAGRAACPACNKTIRTNTLRQLYLPGAH